MPVSLVLFLAQPYLAGTTCLDAVRVARQIYSDDHFCATLDILGEDCDNVADCESSVKNYKELVDVICSAPVTCANAREQMTISMKPSMFSVVAPSAGSRANSQLDEAYARIKSVVDYAFHHQVNVTLEAEDHRWTDFQLEAYLSLVNEGYTNLGTVLQSRLFRTRDDIKRFDERMRVRLVIGIYNEAAEIAHTDKRVMKELLVECAQELFKRGTYVELATHDTACLASFFRKAVIPQRAPGSRFETQFLMGVPRRKIQESLISGSYFASWDKQLSQSELEHVRALAAAGILVRLYLPFGEGRTAAAYCKRRLKANPNIIGYGIKNLLHIQ